MFEKILSHFRKKQIFQLAPWIEGQYVTYYLETPDKKFWWASSLHAVKKIENKWLMVLFHRTNEKDCRVIAEVFEQKPEKILEVFLPKNIEGLRGDPPDNKDITNITATAINQLNIRFSQSLANGVDKKSIAQIENFYGIDKAIRIVEPWEEFKYEQIHYMHSAVFLTGVVKTECNDKRFLLKATSFGLNNPELGYQDMPYSFVDFFNFKRIGFDNFYINIPATWFITKTPGENGEPDVYMTCNGGNDHACTLRIEICGNDKYEAFYAERYKIIAEAGNTPNNTRKIFPENKETGFIAADTFERDSIRGYQLYGIYINRQSGKTGFMIANFCYLKDNPLIKEADTTFEIVKTIVEGFELK